MSYCKGCEKTVPEGVWIHPDLGLCAICYSIHIHSTVKQWNPKEEKWEKKVGTTAQVWKPKKCKRCKKSGIWIHPIVHLCDPCIEKIVDCQHCDPDYCEGGKVKNCFMIKDWFVEQKNKKGLMRFI